MAVPTLSVPPAAPEIAQLPFAILKHPLVSWMPLAKVELAFVPSTFRVLVAVSPATVVVPKREEPWTEKRKDELVVPTPTVPFCITLKSVP